MNTGVNGPVLFVVSTWVYLCLSLSDGIPIVACCSKYLIPYRLPSPYTRFTPGTDRAVSYKRPFGHLRVFALEEAAQMRLKNDVKP